MPRELCIAIKWSDITLSISTWHLLMRPNIYLCLLKSTYFGSYLTIASHKEKRREAGKTLYVKGAPWDLQCLGHVRMIWHYMSNKYIYIYNIKLKLSVFMMAASSCGFFLNAMCGGHHDIFSYASTTGTLKEREAMWEQDGFVSIYVPEGYR